METNLNEMILAWKAGTVPPKTVEDHILTAVFEHLRSFRRNQEDDISAFLVEFQPRILGLIERFREIGVPFRHFLFRTVRWQWTTFKSERDKEQSRGFLLEEPACWEYGTVTEPFELAEGADHDAVQSWDPVRKRRLLLLALKAAPFLDESAVERLCSLTGVDLAWLQAQLYETRHRMVERLEKNRALTHRRSEVFMQRLLAEEQARKEPDPERRKVWEGRAQLYRRRLASLLAKKKALNVSPTHLDLSRMLGIPKGTVDSSLFHLKKELGNLYTGACDHPPRHQQPPQKRRTRTSVSRSKPAVAP